MKALETGAGARRMSAAVQRGAFPEARKGSAAKLRRGTLRSALRRRPNSVEHHHFEPPRLRELARRAAPQVIEATLVPLVLFYAGLLALGPRGAICAALGWNYAALFRRLWCHERVPGVLLIATAGLTARSLVALFSHGSLFVYFLQPSLATALVGGAFLLSVPLGRPLAERLAHDFVPLPPGFVKRPKVRQLFVRISLFWALVSLANAAGTILMLLSMPIATYAAAKTGFSAALTVGGVVVSSWWFRRSLRRNGMGPLPAAEGVTTPTPVPAPLSA